MLGKGIEKFDKLTSDPISYIWDQVKDINYRYHSDKDDKGHKELTDTVFKHWRILTPKEVLAKKYGICYDTSVAVAYLATLSHLPYHYIHVFGHDGRSHAISLVQYSSQWYWIEASWYSNKGIHGPYSSIQKGGYTLRKDMYNSTKTYAIYWTSGITVDKLFTDKHTTYDKYMTTLHVSQDLHDQIHGEQRYLLKDSIGIDVDKEYFVKGIRYKDHILEWNPINPVSKM